MIKQILIPVAAFAVTVTGASAFSGDIFDKLDVTLSDDQLSALETVHELRKEGATRDEIQVVLDNVGLDRKTMSEMHQAKKEYMGEQHQAVKDAVESGHYNDFVHAIAGTPLADVIHSETDFNSFVEAHELMKSGDKAGAHEIFATLGLERPGHQDRRGEDDRRK